MKKDRPKITIKKEPLDNILEAIGWLALVALIALPAYYYGQLPDEIPSHYNASGEVDAMRGKGSIWTLPIIGAASYFLLLFINQKPHIFNYPTKITELNAEHQYRTATRLIRFINVGTVLVFLYITWRTIQTALGNANGLGKSFLIIFVLATVFLISFFLGKSMSKK